MTYFLAITSGIPPDVALKIALATQYVDENDATKPPSGPGELLSDVALTKYHFTLDYGIPSMIKSWIDDTFGTHLDDGSWETPDQTYNTEEFKIDATCKSLVDPGSGTTTDLSFTSKANCESQGGKYTAASSWQYNELRTLRMEYEVFNKLKSDFSTEIAANQAQGGKAATWNDLAGTTGWDDSAARIGGNPLAADGSGKLNLSGVSGSDKLQNVLQQFNAAGNADKYDVLNNWLKSNGYITNNMPHLVVTKNSGTAKEESELKGTSYFNDAQNNRKEFLNWIPQQTTATSGVKQPGATTALTPSDSKHSTSDEFGVILPPNTGVQTQTSSNP